MLIEVNTTWTATGNGGGGKTLVGTGTAFNTDTHQVVPFYESRNAAILDPLPPAVHRQAGDVLHVECDADLSATLWVYGGGTAVSSRLETHSAVYCGWTPPTPPGPSCALGTATLTQGGTPAGLTLTAHYDGAAVGPIRYALDGGPEQAGATFPVAPGTRTVRIRDTGVAGCTRAVTVVVSAAPLLLVPAGAPTGVDFVGQPLWYQPAGVPASAQVVVEVWAESAHNADDFAKVFEFRKWADAQGRVAFQLDGVLWPRLSAWVPPAAAVGAQICRTPLVNYFLRTVVYAPGQAPTYSTGPLRTALRGGLPAERRDIDYFAYRLEAYGQPPFLSWQPAGKTLTPQQPEWLFWLCPAAVPSVLTIRRAYVRTGFAASPPLVVDETLNLAGGRGAQNRLIAIPVLPRAGTDSVSVSLYDPAGEFVSGVVSYAMVDPTPRTRYLQFTNSLGGCDTLRTEGRLEATLEGVATGTDVVATPGGPAPAAGRQAYDVVATRKLKLATGWLKAAELQWLQELVLSRELWEWQPGRVLPLDAAKRQLAYHSDEQPLRGLLLEFDYAFAPTAYANL